MYVKKGVKLKMEWKKTRNLVWKMGDLEKSPEDELTGGKGNWIEEACASCCFMRCHAGHITMRIPRLPDRHERNVKRFISTCERLTLCDTWKHGRGTRTYRAGQFSVHFTSCTYRKWEWNDIEADSSLSVRVYQLHILHTQLTGSVLTQQLTESLWYTDWLTSKQLIKWKSN
jgi:hypothetical protein